MSKCSNCQNTTFKIQEQSPIGSAFKVNFIQCSKCGAPVGVVDYFDVHSGINSLHEKLENIKNMMSHLDYKVDEVLNNQRR